MGGIVNAVTGIFGANDKKHAAQDAQNLDLTGFNYLTQGAGAAPANQIINAGLQGSQVNQNALGMRAALLGVPMGGMPGVGGMTPGPNPQPVGGVGAPGDAFQNYLNSTAYQFQLGQGQNAINSNAAARGLLGSGGTAKGLEQYGQNLAGTTFNNYLQQLAALGTGGLNTSGQGANVLSSIGTLGSSGGRYAGDNAINEGNARADQTNQIGNLVSGLGGFFVGMS